MKEAPTQGRLHAFRLTDVPLGVRRRAGGYLLRDAAADGRLLDAVTIKAAIERPSLRVYRVSAAAWSRVLG